MGDHQDDGNSASTKDDPKSEEEIPKTAKAPGGISKAVNTNPPTKNQRVQVPADQSDSPVQKTVNPCLCCMSCGLTLRQACIFVEVYYLFLGVCLLVVAFSASIIDPKGKGTCGPKGNKGDSWSAYHSDCDRAEFMQKNETNCILLDECRTNFHEVLALSAVRGVLYVGAFISLAVVVGTLRASQLAFVSSGFVIFSEVLNFITMYYASNVQGIRRKLHPHDNKHDSESEGMIAIVSLVCGLALQVYCCICALALHFQIRAGEYKQRLNQVYAILAEDQAEAIKAATEGAPPYNKSGTYDVVISSKSKLRV